MGSGILLVVVGALLTFAVEDHVPDLNLKAAGIILMLAGAVVIWHARANEVKERTVTLTDESSDPDLPTHTIEERVREQGD
jgi:uncharacterized protein YjeT (DUF2065 family)